MKRFGFAISVVLTGLLVAGCTSGEGGGIPFGGSTTSIVDATSTAPVATTAPGPGGASTTAPSTSGTITSTTQGGGAQPTTTVTTGESTTTTSTTTTTTTVATIAQPSPRPVPLREGLASFNTYTFVFEVSTVGPTPQDSTVISATLEANTGNDRRRTLLESTVSTAEDGPSSGTQEVIQVGERVCTFDGDEYTVEVLTPQQKEFADILSGLVDIVFSTEDGTFVGNGEVAGLPARHYRYSLPGLGQESGALVVENQIDYWVSDDGNVLVKYDALIETRTGPSTDPDAEVFRIQTTAELLAANGRVGITLPVECRP